MHKRRTPGKAHLLLAFTSGITVLFLGLPVIVLTVRGIASRGWEGVSGNSINQAVILSLFTTFFASILIVLMGTPLAYVLARWRFTFKNFLTAIIALPIVLPPAVAGLALLLTLGRRGLLGPALTAFDINLPFTTAAVIVAQTFVSAPFFIMLGRIGFNNVPQEIEDAARVDGASGLTLFRLITLPLSFRALAAGMILSWTRALGEFGATILFAGSISGRTQTMPLLVYNVIESDLNAAIWTSLLLLAMAIIALLISQPITSKLLKTTDERDNP